MDPGLFLSRFNRLRVQAIAAELERVGRKATAIYFNPDDLYTFMLAAKLSNNFEGYNLEQDRKGNVTFKGMQLIPEPRLPRNEMQVCYMKEPVFEVIT